jgi:flagellar biosynthetic protein FliR
MDTITQPLTALLTAEVLRAFLVFARIGTALMVVPGFGEIYVFARFRLLLALASTLALAPVLAPHLPPLPSASDPQLMLLAGGEVIRGLAIGIVTRVTMVAVGLAGTLIATQSGLASAVFFDPNEATQASIGGTFMSVAALTLLFATDAHHDVLQALVQSYAALPMGQPLPLGDSAQLLTQGLGAATRTGLQIAAPVIVASLLLSAVLGALGRLVPSLQVLFVATPVQLTIALGVAMMSLAAGLHAFLRLYAGSVQVFAG